MNFLEYLSSSFSGLLFPQEGGSNAGKLDKFFENKVTELLNVSKALDANNNPGALKSSASPNKACVEVKLPDDVAGFGGLEKVNLNGLKYGSWVQLVMTHIIDPDR